MARRYDPTPFLRDVKQLFVARTKALSQSFTILSALQTLESCVQQIVQSQSSKRVCKARKRAGITATPNAAAALPAVSVH